MLGRTGTEKGQILRKTFTLKSSDRKQTQASKNSVFAHMGELRVTASAGKNVRMRKSMGERHGV